MLMLAENFGIPAALCTFAPSYSAAMARVQAIHPAQYARTRNALDGAVTGLSPYLTHGIISMVEVARTVAQKHPLRYEEKIVFELGWREFFQHVWASSKRVNAAQGMPTLGHLQDAILQDMRPANLWAGKPAQAMPADIVEGRTGIAAIDTAVRQLYATGYLHNHVRMWLASYCVHLRKIHWRVGADWMIGHLLDGDLPSNHLSWQWVAGTFSSKPYLFNASNVAKFAPQSAWKAWASPKTAIDMDYEQLDAIARQHADLGPEPGVHAAVEQPALFNAPPEKALQLPGVASKLLSAGESIDKLASYLIVKRKIEWVHPWALSQPDSNSTSTPQSQPSTALAAPVRIGLVHVPAHARWPWSAKRWEFVLQAMASVCDHVVVGDATVLVATAQAGLSNCSAEHTLYPGYRELLPKLGTLSSAPRLFAQPDALCMSFTKFYERVQRAQSDFSKLL